MIGSMKSAASLGKSVKTDGAIYSALDNRLAPQRSLPFGLTPGNDTATASVQCIEAGALFGADGIAFPSDVRCDVNESLAMHGFSVCQNVYTPRCDGRRVDIELRPWPMEHIRFNASKRVLETRTDGGRLEEIRHGDGRWTVFAQSRMEPWGWGALVALALIWADRAYGVRDRSRASTSHGNAKMLGQLPQGVPINSDEGAAYLLLLQTMHESLPFGIEPFGAKTQMLVNTSTSWQIFKEIIDSNLADAARVLLGHDGTVKATGGNYIKDGFLFGVSADKVEGDLSTIERQLFTGSIEPWAALNFGTSEHAPRARYLRPDPDADALQASVAQRRKDFWDDVDRHQKHGFLLDQGAVDKLAKTYQIEAPMLSDAQGESGEHLADEAAAELAAKMTEYGVERCVHGRTNRCPLCRIERVRDVELDEVSGEARAVPVGWKAIGATVSSPTAPESADPEEHEAPPTSQSGPGTVASVSRLRVAR